MLKGEGMKGYSGEDRKRGGRRNIRVEGRKEKGMVYEVGQDES